MNLTSRILSYASVALVCGALADDEQMSLLHERPIWSLEETGPDASGSFWERFQSAWDYRVDDVFTSRFQPFRVMGWTLKHPEDSWSQFLERGNRTARSSLGRSIEYSLRDAAVSLPIIGWLEMQEEVLGELLTDSVDAVEEEAITPTDPWIHPAELGWWRSLAERRVLRYGVRPFRTDPYAFLSVRFKEGDRLLALGHVRYYFRDFADHRFELALSLPVTKGFSLDVGTAYQFGRHEDEKKIVVKLFKPLKRGMIHLGVEIEKQPTLLAGLSMSW